jgi:hypothetical protein
MRIGDMKLVSVLFRQCCLLWCGHLDVDYNLMAVNRDVLCVAFFPLLPRGCLKIS